LTRWSINYKDVSGSLSEIMCESRFKKWSASGGDPTIQKWAIQVMFWVVDSPSESPFFFEV
jgi:hypothetical protein